jgi:hypothetical protein
MILRRSAVGSNLLVSSAGTFRDPLMLGLGFNDGSSPVRALRLKDSNPALRTPTCPYVALQWPHIPQKFTR